jgi:DNA-binding protein HU-beta
VNKSGLIDAISDTTSLARREAEDAVNALVHDVVGEIRSERCVAVVGFGSINPTQRGARTGRHPQTAAPVKIAATRGVRIDQDGSWTVPGDRDRPATCRTDRQAFPGHHGREACPGEEKSKAIGQQGRTAGSGDITGEARPGEESNKAIGQEGR